VQVQLPQVPNQPGPGIDTNHLLVTVGQPPLDFLCHHSELVRRPPILTGDLGGRHPDQVVPFPHVVHHQAHRLRLHHPAAGSPALHRVQQLEADQRVQGVQGELPGPQERHLLLRPLFLHKPDGPFPALDEVTRPVVFA